ncbi:GIP [Symbiodinium natans]|uniref:GIP protein n=1 Tax=Symbiodinium natans TaxID=878477 RepID=A0A812PD78_9DINO|nr:GIP [Symbiodinium natans]
MKEQRAKEELREQQRRAEEAAAMEAEYEAEEDDDDLMNFPPNFSVVDVQLLLSDAAVRRTERLRDLRGVLQGLVTAITAKYWAEAWVYSGPELRAQSNLNPWAFLVPEMEKEMKSLGESGRFFLSRNDAGTLHDMLRSMKTVKSQLKMETGYHLCSIVLLAMAAACDDACAQQVLLLQNGLHIHSRALETPNRSRPWDTHFYLVGTHHKAGSQLTRNTMKWAFDYLGANYSCQEELSQRATITTAGGRHKCFLSPDCRIHFDNTMSLDTLQRNRQLAGAAGLKVVQTVRDPKAMLASAYCYHHRGEEPGNPIATWPDIMTMGPLEGMRDLFPGMMVVFRDMLEIYQNSGRDTYNSRFEDLSYSSDSFDVHVKTLFDFMFGDLLTEEEHEHIRELAKHEDLHRGENGLSAGINHTNSEDCERNTRAVLEQAPDMYEAVQEIRHALGYLRRKSQMQGEEAWQFISEDAIRELLERLLEFRKNLQARKQKAAKLDIRAELTQELAQLHPQLRQGYGSLERIIRLPDN